MSKIKPSVFVFACGEPARGEGGSGFEAMVKATRTDPPILNAWICAVVSNHCSGGLPKKRRGSGSSFCVGKGLLQPKAIKIS